MNKKFDHVRIEMAEAWGEYRAEYASCLESDSLLQGKFAPSLLEALKQDPVGFRENGYVETDADRKLAAVA